MLDLIIKLLLRPEEEQKEHEQLMNMLRVRQMEAQKQVMETLRQKQMDVQKETLRIKDIARQKQMEAQKRRVSTHAGTRYESEQARELLTDEEEEKGDMPSAEQQEKVKEGLGSSIDQTADQQSKRPKREPVKIAGVPLVPRTIIQGIIISEILRRPGE